ncbi:MAG: pyruvate dehydrogenase (acetyl-transferring), homodimeric type [Pseudomonadota bacterium]
MSNTRKVVSDQREDEDPEETSDWLQSLESVLEHGGRERAAYLLRRLALHGQHLGLSVEPQRYSAYRNSIPLQEQPPYPGDLGIEQRLVGLMRWNALCMVARANAEHGELGGHIATYASAAEIFETGFNHFFRGPDAADGGDLVYFQPHSSPGIYARAFMEGRIDESHLLRFRRETEGGGLSSYPHPMLMPQFWQFPTGSMGIGAINAIYQARFLRYLQARGMADTHARRVWGIFGDGEMDEPESIAALSLAARERLGNLTFIINCNLQRLDGPVRGNGQIIQELESLFAGAGWHVLKVLWSSDWDALFAADKHHALLRHFASTVDGQYQTLGANDGEYNKAHFFAPDPELQALVSHMSAAQINDLRRGGHDMRKLYAAFAKSAEDPDRPTVILAKTKKGFGMGAAGESRMTAHQQKKLNDTALLEFRDRFELPLTDKQVAEMAFWRPTEGSVEHDYLQARREALGGYLPCRRTQADKLPVPPLESHAAFALQADDHVMSTTSAWVRQLSQMLKDPTLGPRIVPIVADEARTFGMAPLFRQIGIYSPDGQRYNPEDAKSLLVYRESVSGQLLEEGITEAGSMSSWVAAATSYSTNALAMLPVYIFYSIFGFQRIGDLIWAAADQRARGFLIGATAGRTTLSGEGLQHQDGSSHVMAATVTSCRAYDPAFAYEVAVLFDYGSRRLLQAQVDEFYYLTVSNESFAQPSLPAYVDQADIIAGLYLYRRFGGSAQADLRLLGSGPILNEVLGAAEQLAQVLGCVVEVHSLTSASEVIRDANEAERWNRLNRKGPRRTSHLQRMLPGKAPIVAATDYVRAVVQPMAAHLESRLVVLGTDGFGRSDTRAKLREFFEVDRQHVFVAGVNALLDVRRITESSAMTAMRAVSLTPAPTPPWGR